MCSHEVHDFYVDFHPSARQFKKRLAVHLQERAANMYPSSLALSSAGPANSRKPRVPAKSLSLEMVNFQDPEVRHTYPLPHTTDIEHRIIFTAFEPFSYQARGNALFLLECGNTGLNSLLLGHAHALVGLVTPLYIQHFALVCISYRFPLLSFAFHPCSGVSVTSSTHRIHIT